MTKTIHVPLKNIFPDENQPRKQFDPADLRELASSIKKHGIMNPIVVEDMKNGNYLLVDGERRYRAAKELKMKEVPVTVQEAGTGSERLIKQFHLQMQHRDWLPTEKAVAIGTLAEDMKLSYKQTAELLSIPTRTVQSYLAFYSLVNRKDFEKNDLPILLASSINRVTKAAKSIYENTFEKEFTKDAHSALEKKLISNIKSGALQKKSDFSDLKDAFTQEPDSIESYIKTDQSAKNLFFSTKAKGARAARITEYTINYLINYLNKVESQNAHEHFTENIVSRTKSLQKSLERLLTRVE